MLLGNRVLLLDLYVTSTAPVWARVCFSKLLCHWLQGHSVSVTEPLTDDLVSLCSKRKTSTWLLLETTVFSSVVAAVAAHLTLSATMLLGNWLCFHHKHWNPCLPKVSFKGGYTTLKRKKKKKRKKSLRRVQIFSLTLSWRVTWRVFSKISHSSLSVGSFEICWGQG